MSRGVGVGSPPPMGPLQIKWDPKNLEIRTKSVEKTLEPLVTQVSAKSQSPRSLLKVNACMCERVYGHKLGEC